MTADATRSPADIDGFEPEQVVAPESAEALARELASAAGNGLAVVPRGGGTQMALGALPRRVDTVLSTALLAGVVDHSPADLTATFQAGTTLAAVQEALALHGQQVPIDAPLPQRATIGGILAAAGSGPRRLAYGNRRECVIGITTALADGTLARGGGRVVKNVTGYDMMRLHVGALGTLGIIVEATFKLMPLPRATRTLVARFDRPYPALQAARELLATRLQPLALDVLSGAVAPGGPDTGWVLAAEFGGGTAAVDRLVRDASALLRADGAAAEALDDAAGFWAGVRDFGRDEGGIVLRVAVLPAGQPDAWAAVEKAAQSLPTPAAVVFRAGNGILYLYWTAQAAAIAPAGRWGGLVNAIRGASASLGGSTVVEECPPALKHDIDVWGPPGSAFAVMRRMKEQFDPKGILNPGRFIGGL